MWGKDLSKIRQIKGAQMIGIESVFVLQTAEMVGYVQ